MGLRFYIGGSGSGKSESLYEEVIAWSMRKTDKNFFVIVPDQFTMQTQMDLVRKHPDQGIMNIDVLSFGRLSHRVFEEVGGNDKPILDDTGKSLLLRKIAGELADKLPVIGGNLKKIGYIHEVKSAISEFLQYGIGSKELAELIDFSASRGALQYKLQDLKVLYEGFLSFIEGHFITTEESLSILRRVLPQSEKIRGSVIVFDGFTGFTPVQNSVIQELMVLAEEVIITIVIDSKENPYRLDGEQQLFYLSQKTVVTLEKLAKEAHAARGKDKFLQGAPVKRYEKNESLAYLEQSLFRFGKKPFETEPASILLYEALSPREEIRYVCRKIWELVRKEQYCFRDIAVVTGDLAGYAHVAEHEFAHYEIPCFLDRTEGIVLNPFIEYIRSGLSVIIHDFSYETLLHFLRSGLTKLHVEQIDQMENYVLALGIRGVRRWKKLWMRKSRQMGEEFTEELGALNAGRETLLAQLKPLTSLRKKAHVSELVRGVYAFITEASLQQRLHELELHFKAKGDLAKAKEYAQIYRLVMELLNQIMELLGEETMDLEEFSKILDAGFGEIEVGTIPQNADGVVIGDIERTRLKKVKALFFIGINDGIIPKSSGAGGLLSDIDREFLQGSTLELSPTPRQQMYQQRLYLYMNMTKPSEKLYLSFADVSSEGKSIRPAYLIGMIRRMYPKLILQKGKALFVEELVTKRASIPYLADGLRGYVAQQVTGEAEKELFALYRQFRGRETKSGLLQQLTQAAFYEYREHPLGKAAARALYGSVLESSVSRLETYASCAYAHFLEYGLMLREREEYSFEAVDMGNVFHGVLEAFAGKLEKTPYTWFDFPKEIGESLVEEALESYAAEYGNTVLFSSARNAYIITRMKRILKRTVSVLQYQLKKGIFMPNKFELSFSAAEDLEAVRIDLTPEETMRLRGRIDRIDTYEDEANVYVKVIDYKSGNRSFDLVALYYGLQLQLVLYLNAALELTRKQHAGKEAVPAAVLYYKVADPMVERGTSPISTEELHAKIREELKTTGVINSNRDIVSKLDAAVGEKSDVIPVAYKKDGSFTAASSVMEEADIRAVSAYVGRKIKQIGGEILDGQIGIHPYEKGMQDSCTYCAYAGVCGYDSKIKGFSKRNLDVLKKEEALEKIREEAGEEPEGEER